MLVLDLNSVRNDITYTQELFPFLATDEEQHYIGFTDPVVLARAINELDEKPANLADFNPLLEAPDDYSLVLLRVKLKM